MFYGDNCEVTNTCTCKKGADRLWLASFYLIAGLKSGAGILISVFKTSD